MVKAALLLCIIVSLTNKLQKVVANHSKNQFDAHKKSKCVKECKYGSYTKTFAFERLFQLSNPSQN